MKTCKILTTPFLINDDLNDGQLFFKSLKHNITDFTPGYGSEIRENMIAKCFRFLVYTQKSGAVAHHIFSCNSDMYFEILELSKANEI